MDADRTERPNSATSRSDAAAAPELWQFVAPRDYRPPSVPASSAAARAWASVKHLLRRADKDVHGPIRKEADLRTLPEVRLRHLVPAIDWRDAATALDAVLVGDRRGAAAGTTVVVGQPHCGHADIVRHWAKRHHAVIVEPPAVERILAGDRRWLDDWPAPGQAWALPALERCFLRHAHGLDLVREALARASGAHAGRGLIGCDSWAWAYLQRVWPVPFADVLTLQAFDAARLSRLFAELAATGGAKAMRFRNARTGEDVLSLPLPSEEVSAEIVQLAAHCRGNVGTARAYWRERLRAAPEEDEAADSPEDAATDGGGARADAVWVSSQLHEPVLPLECGEDIAFVLHALLLHNGLPEALLPQLLPLPPHQCTAILLRLQRIGLVRADDGFWSVDALGYAVARGLLHGRDYLTDEV